MNSKTTYFSLALAILFAMDITNPFAYSLRIEFLFLGIIVTALYAPLSKTILIAALFGYVKDIMVYNSFAINTLEYPLILVALHALRNRLLSSAGETRQISMRLGLVFLALSIHATIQTLFATAFYPKFTFLFVIHSFILYVPVSFIIRKWIKVSHVEFI